jgi:VWFA-related protein
LRCWWCAGIAFTLAALTGSAFAQRAAPSSTSAAADTVPTIVHVDVAVTDARGKPIAGLATKDFVLKDEGIVQTIDSADARKRLPRRLALLLDEFHVGEQRAARVRDALATFVDEHLGPDDMVVVLKPLDSLRTITLTSDREEIHAAIATFEGRAGNYTPRTPLEEQTVGRAPALAERARAQIVLSAIRALAPRVGTAAGRPAIILVSEGFAERERAYAVRALPDAGMVERFANRYDVPIYALDPRDAASDAPDEEAGTMLRRLARQTGGLVFEGSDLEPSLAQIARELDAGYTLSYRPSQGPDGKFHTIDVQVRRRDALVRARSGYVSPPSAEMRRAMRAAATVDTALPRPLRQSPLINVWSGVTRASDNRGRVVVTWEPGRSLGGTMKSSAVTVALKATTKDGAPLFEGVLAPVRGALASAGIPADRAEFDAPAGRVQLDMTILGERGEQLDMDARDLDVPPTGGARTLLLPPVLLATRSAREFREVSADENAVPGPSREFSRTERLVVRVPALAPESSTPRVTARLLNRSGQVVRDLAPLDETRGGVVQFDLPLAPLAPGDYFLLVTAIADAGAAEERVSLRITG